MTGGGAPAPGPPPDAQYEWMHRRAARRVAGLTAVCVTVGLVAIFAVSGWAGPRNRPLGGQSPAAAPGAGPDGCSSIDLAKPALTTMPTPQVVTAPLTIRPGPDVERLSPPDTSPAVAASRAWKVMRRIRSLAPTTAGSAQVLLGDLYAATPAVERPGQPARPVYTHTLVWAIYGRHQPERPSAGGPADAPCYFESTVVYVDAMTGRPLVAEVFPPPAPPAPLAA